MADMEIRNVKSSKSTGRSKLESAGGKSNRSFEVAVKPFQAGTFRIEYKCTMLLKPADLGFVADPAAGSNWPLGQQEEPVYIANIRVLNDVQKSQPEDLRQSRRTRVVALLSKMCMTVMENVDLFGAVHGDVTIYYGARPSPPLSPQEWVEKRKQLSSGFAGGLTTRTQTAWEVAKLGSDIPLEILFDLASSEDFDDGMLAGIGFGEHLKVAESPGTDKRIVEVFKDGLLDDSSFVRSRNVEALEHDIRAGVVVDGRLADN